MWLENSKDIIVFYNHYRKIIYDLHGTLEEFFELFLKWKNKESTKKNSCCLHILYK